MTKLRFLGPVTVKARLEVKTGLHIGAGKDTIEIGGLDNSIIKHPVTREPYIPGSSLKGKLRALGEWSMDKLRNDGQPWGANTKTVTGQTFDIKDPILRLFGTAAQKQNEWKGGPTRLLCRDAFLNAAWRNEQLERGLTLTEIKPEVVMNRLTGKVAGQGGPRKMERVPPGAAFDVEMAVRLYEVDDDGGRDDVACLNRLLSFMRLLEDDALGGSGSRGYGRVAFNHVTVHAAGLLDPEHWSLLSLPPFDKDNAPTEFVRCSPPAG